MGVEAASERIKVLARPLPYAGVPRCSGVTRGDLGTPGSTDPWSSCSPRADGVAAAASSLSGFLCPPLCRRQGVVSICGVSGRGRWFVQVSLCFCLWLAEVAKGEEVEVLDLFLDGVVVVVVLCGVFAPAGRGGEGSGRLEDGCDGWLVWLLRSRREVWWSVDAGARLSSFIVLGVRRVAAAGSVAFFNVGGACFPGLGGTAFSGGG